MLARKTFLSVRIKITPNFLQGAVLGAKQFEEAGLKVCHQIKFQAKTESFFNSHYCG